MAEWLNIIRCTPLTYLSKAVTFIGNEGFLCFFLPVIYWCWKKRSGAHLILLVILSSYLTFLLKSFFGWERPPSELWLINTGGYSFPSSHAVNAVIVWGFLAYEMRKKWFTILSIALILLIAFSRVYLGVHYIRDVLAGIAFGAIILHSYKWSLRWSTDLLARLNDIIKVGIAIAIGILMLIIQTNPIVAISAGLFAGIATGFLIEPHFADFATKDIWFRVIIRLLPAFLISLAIWQGMEWIFPESVSFTWFQYFILGIWVMAGSPWLFVQLRLAHRES